MPPLCTGIYRFAGIIKKPISTVIPTAMRGAHTAVISIAVSAALSVVSAFPTATSTSPATTQRTGSNGAFRFGGLPVSTAVTWCGVGPWRSLSGSTSSGSSLRMSATAAADFTKQEIAANKVVVFRYVPCTFGVGRGVRVGNGRRSVLSITVSVFQHLTHHSNSDNAFL
jgi:hypothetical protein